MTGTFLALLLFGAIAAVTMVMTASDDEVAEFVDDMPAAKPKPGARDIYAIAGPAFGRAPVPSWG